MTSKLAREDIVRAATQAKALLTLSASMFDPRAVLEWLDSVQYIASALRDSNHIGLAAGWSDPRNSFMLFKHAAMSLAHKCWPNRRLTDALNSFANSSPHLFRNGDLWYTYDFFSTKIDMWQRLLGPLRNLPALRFLEIGSFEGLSSCWLLTNILTHQSGTLLCIDSQHPISPPFRLIHRNWHAIGAGGKATLISNSSLEALTAFDLTT